MAVSVRGRGFGNALKQQTGGQKSSLVSEGVDLAMLSNCWPGISAPHGCPRAWIWQCSQTNEPDSQRPESVRGRGFGNALKQINAYAWHFNRVRGRGFGNALKHRKNCSRVCEGVRGRGFGNALKPYADDTITIAGVRGRGFGNALKLFRDHVAMESVSEGVDLAMLSNPSSDPDITYPCPRAWIWQCSQTSASRRPPPMSCPRAWIWQCSQTRLCRD